MKTVQFFCSTINSPPQFPPLLLTIIALSSFSHCGDLLEENSREENLPLSLLTPLLYFLQPLLIVACLEKPNHPFVKSTPISSFLTEVFRLFLLFFSFTYIRMSVIQNSFYESLKRKWQYKATQALTILMLLAMCIIKEERKTVRHVVFFVSVFKREGKNDKEQKPSVKHLSLTAPP